MTMSMYVYSDLHWRFIEKTHRFNNELIGFIPQLISKVRGQQAAPAQNSIPSGRVRGLSSAAGGGRPAPTLGHQSKSSVGGRIQVQGSSANVTHTINEDERTEFTRHINAVLAGDPDIGHRLPFPTDTFEMFDDCKDGLVLAKLINDSVPDTIDERVLNRPGKKIKTLNAFHMTENNNIVINSAKGIGCSVVNIGSGDIIEVREHLILGLIWQVIRRGLLGKIDIKLHPELYRLLEEDETLEQFLRLPPEQILLRWFNYHLKNAKWDKRYANYCQLRALWLTWFSESRTSLPMLRKATTTRCSSINLPQTFAAAAPSKPAIFFNVPSKSFKTPTDSIVASSSPQHLS